MVLVVGPVERVPRRVPPLLEEEPRLVEVLPLPGHAVELDEADLHLLVARRVEPPAGAEDLRQEIGALQGHVEQGALARGLVVRDRGLVEVAQVVQLVAARDVRPAGPADAAGGLLRQGRDRARRVEVAVVLLGGRDLRDDLVDVALEPGVGAKAQRVGGALDHLVDVGVVEAEEPHEVALREAPGDREVGDAARRLALVEVVAHRDRAVRLEPWRPEAVLDLDGGEGDRPDRVVSPGCRGGASRHSEDETRGQPGDSAPTRECAPSHASTPDRGDKSPADAVAGRAASQSEAGRAIALPPWHGRSAQRRPSAT